MVIALSALCIEQAHAARLKTNNNKFQIPIGIDRNMKGKASIETTMGFHDENDNSGDVKNLRLVSVTSCVTCVAKGKYRVSK